MTKPFTATKYMPHPYYVSGDAPLVPSGKWMRLRRALKRRDDNAYRRVLGEYRLTLQRIN